MTSTWRCWGWKLGIASSLAMGGALALGGGLSPIASSGDSALAQITPDGTLGAESSVVRPTNINGLPTERIDGGARRGVNLFHSFEQFSVPAGSAAYFNNALDIRIKASGIFGTEGRKLQTPKSDITASSNLGPQFSGIVEINKPDADPSQGLVTLPAQLVDASGLIAQGCPGGGRQGQSEFIVTGRGGLPPNSSEALSSEPVQVDWVTLYPKVENRSSPDVSTNLTSDLVAINSDV